MVSKRFRDKLNNIGRNMGDSLSPYLPDYFPIAWKMAFIFSVLIITGLAFLGSIILNAQLERMQAQADDYGTVIALQLAQAAREPVLAADEFTLQVLVNQLAEGNQLLGAALFDRQGALLFAAGEIPPKTQPTQTQSHVQWHNGGDPLTTYYTPISVEASTAGHAAITLSRQPILQARTDAQDTIVSVTLLMAAVAIVVSFLVSRRLSQPIHNLLAATRALGSGDLQFRMDERRSDEIGQLVKAYNIMANGLLEKDQVQKVLSRFVSPSVATRMMADLEQVSLGGQQVEATVVFADIVGFTELSEQMAPDAVAEMLNGYFDAITMASTFYRGTIDKYMGDCAMIVFGVPEQDSEHAYHGICCAVMIQRLIERYNTMRSQRGLTTVRFRVGLNSGEMLAGNLGSRDRMQYTVVGDSVNLASRLSNMAGPGEIAAPEGVIRQAHISSRVRTSEAGIMRLRGKKEAVSTFLIEGVHSHSETLMEQRIAQFLEQLFDDGNRSLPGAS